MSNTTPADGSADTLRAIELQRLAEEAVGGEKAEEVAESAREVLERMQADGQNAETIRKDIENFSNLMLSMGLEVPRVLLKAAVNAGSLPDDKKKTLLRRVRDVSPIAEVGSMQVDFVKDGEPRKAYIVYKECGADYDAGAQLAKIDPYVDEAGKKTLREQMGHMELLGRQAYARTLVHNTPLLKKIKKGLPADFDFRVLNRREICSFFLDVAPETMVGVHVVYDTEAEADRAAGGAAKTDKAER